MQCIGHIVPPPPPTCSRTFHHPSLPFPPLLPGTHRSAFCSAARPVRTPAARGITQCARGPGVWLLSLGVMSVRPAIPFSSSQGRPRRCGRRARGQEGAEGGAGPARGRAARGRERARRGPGSSAGLCSVSLGSGGLAHPCAASQVYKGYVDDPRNTDNAWIETVAISIHFSDQSDTDLKRLNSVWGWAAGSGRGRGGARGL